MFFFTSKILSYLPLLLIFLGWSCTAKQVDRSPHIKEVDEYFQSRRFAQALDIIRLRTQKSADKDRLLYLMEAGTILHTLREWEKSNRAFIEADEIANSILLSRGKEILAFFVSKNEQNFIGENFERVKIKLYIALNYLMLGDKGKALAYSRSLNQELTDIRYEGNDYQQNFAARFLGAILSEEDKDYNFARVQYNNMLNSEAHSDLAEQSLYHLALLENDTEMIQKYASRKDEVIAYTTNMERTPFPVDPAELGNLVLIHEAGIAPHKVPKGKIKNDPFFQVAFKTALITLIATGGHAGLDATVLLNIVGEAQNPIAVYKERVEKNTAIQPKVLIGGLPFTPYVLDDYSVTVKRNYNDKYEDYVNYNIANIATRVLAVYLTSKVVESQGDKSNQGLFSFLGLLVNVIGGSAIYALLEPDLRSWNLTYSNLQMKRIFLQPGTYDLKVDPIELHYLSEIPEKITIEPGKSTFVLLKSF